MLKINTEKILTVGHSRKSFKYFFITQRTFQSTVTTHHGNSPNQWSCSLARVIYPLAGKQGIGGEIITWGPETSEDLRTHDIGSVHINDTVFIWFHQWMCLNVFCFSSLV